MKKALGKIFQFLSFKVLGRSRTKKMLFSLFDLLDLNMLEVAHNDMGVNIYGDNEKTGEEFFINNYLSAQLNKKDAPIIFDVGANTGQYSNYIRGAFPSSIIYAFEPNPKTFERLKEYGTKITRFHAYCLGLGSQKSSAKIFTYKNNLESEHASVLKDVMVTLHNSEDVEELNIDIVTLDDFCTENDIKKIDFLKIDTEGYELEVLRGAEGMIKNEAINIIQFEFNEMNIYSKAFLKNFYDLLQKYDFYRLNTGEMIPLGPYDSKYEIFRYQNIVAVLQKKVDEL